MTSSLQSPATTWASSSSGTSPSSRTNCSGELMADAKWWATNGCLINEIAHNSSWWLMRDYSSQWWLRACSLWVACLCMLHHHCEWLQLAMMSASLQLMCGEPVHVLTAWQTMPTHEQSNSCVEVIVCVCIQLHRVWQIGLQCKPQNTCDAYSICEQLKQSMLVAFLLLALSLYVHLTTPTPIFVPLPPPTLYPSPIPLPHSHLPSPRRSYKEAWHMTSQCFAAERMSSSCQVPERCALLKGHEIWSGQGVNILQTTSWI